MLPPWPEIYRTDAERRHGSEEALAEYERLVPGYERRGYEVVLVPQAPIVDRADFLLREVGLLDH